MEGATVSLRATSLTSRAGARRVIGDLRGRVQSPTGGMASPGCRAREPRCGRSGEIPGPTVRVRMGEGRAAAQAVLASLCIVVQAMCVTSVLCVPRGCPEGLMTFGFFVARARHVAA